MMRVNKKQNISDDNHWYSQTATKHQEVDEWTLNYEHLMSDSGDSVSKYN